MEKVRHWCDSFDCRLMTDKKCSVCSKSFYCSADHQKKEWSKHKKVCKRDELVNGYELCEMLLKLNDRVDLSLTGLTLENVHIDSDNNIVLINLVKDEDSYKMINTPESFGVKDEQERRAYWALRSESSKYVLPMALDSILKLLWKKGKRFIIFSDPDVGDLELSLRNVEIAAWSIIPTIKFGTNFHPPLERTVQITNVIDGYVIDMVAGRFWHFDNHNRPFLLAPHKNYRPFLGERGDTLKPTAEILQKKCQEKPYQLQSAGLLKLVMERLGFSWKEYAPSLLAGTIPMVQEQSIQMMHDFENEALKEMFGEYLKEADTPVTRLLSEISVTLEKQSDSV